MKYIIYILLFLCIGITAKAQFPSQTTPTQYSTGWFRQGWPQADSGTILANRLPNFTPRFPGTTILYQNAGTDTAVHYWTGARWIKISPGNPNLETVLNNGSTLLTNHTVTAQDLAFNIDSAGSLMFRTSVYKAPIADRQGLFAHLDLSPTEIDLFSEKNATTRSFGFQATATLSQMFATGYLSGHTGFVQTDTAQVIFESDPLRFYISHDSATLSNITGGSLDFRMRTLPTTTDTSNYKPLAIGPAGQVKKVSGWPSSGANGLTSVGLSMPSAFTVTNSPLTSNGALNVIGAGTTAQYIRGNGTLATTDTAMIPNFYLKVRGLLTGTSPITFNQTTGAIGINNANTTGTKGAASFTSAFSDNGSGLIDLASIVSTGSCTNCAVTFDAKGRATAFSSGIAPSGSSVDTIFRTPGVDSIYYTINSVQYAIKDSAGSTETANNGLTKTSNNIQLGGALIQPTSITSAAGANRITYSGVSASGDGAQFDVSTTGSIGTAVRGESTDGRGVHGVATTGVGVYASATGSGGIGLFTTTTDGSAIYSTTNASGLVFEGVSIPASTNTVIPVVALTRSAQSAGGTGIGGSIDMFLHTTLADRATNQIIYKLTTATDASYTSSMEFWNANSTTLARKAALAGTGQWTWDGYPALTAQTDTTTYKPVAIDGSGNVVKMIGWAGSGGGGGSQSIQQTLTIGDTSLRKIIYKDTASAVETNSFVFNTVVPSNYGTVYTHGTASLFNSSIAKFHDVNADGRPNVVGNFWSYNTDPGGGRINTNEGGFRFGTETHYQLGAGNDPAFELHLPEVTTESGVLFRPFSMYILKASGYTNTNMQISQLSLKKQLDANVDWLTMNRNNGSVVMTQIGDSAQYNLTHNFSLPGFTGTILYDTLGFHITSSVYTDKILSTNLGISYGDATNLCGVDGYGDRIFREGNTIIANTGARTVFGDWGYNGSQKFLFNKDNAVFSAPLLLNGVGLTMTGGANFVMDGGGVMYPGVGGSALIFSSSGGGGDIKWQDGNGGGRTMTLFKPNDGVANNTNLNVGSSTTNPGVKLKVEGDIRLDTLLYLGRLAADPSVDLVNGAMYYNTASEKFRGYENSAWVNMIGGGGITTLNTLTASTQTFATGTSGSDFGIVSSSSTHTFNLPNAGTSTRGVVSISSQTFHGQKTFENGIIIPYLGSGALVMNSNVSASVEPGISGIGLALQSYTYTDNGSARTETNAENMNLISAPVITSGNAVIYSSNSSTLRISGSPIASGSMTLSHPWALYANDVNFVQTLAIGLNEQSSSATLGNGSMVVYTGTGGHTFTLPALATHPGKVYFIKNAGSGSVTIARGGSDNIYDTGSVTSITVSAGAAVIIGAGSSFWYVQ